MIRLALLLAAMAVLVAAHAASAAGRVALLIGNDRYANPEMALRNPGHDVAALATALEGLGFEVTTAVNADRVAVGRAMERFEGAMAGAGIALLFFAGHGVQIEGENHLLTAGFGTLSLDEVRRESVTLSEIRARFLRARPGLGVIVLDACRNNPFVEAGAAARGLARSQGGVGLLIAYATDPGNVAYDGGGENSLFTRALVANVAAPGVDVRLMFGRVRQQVLLDSAGRQVPWVEESVIGEHVLNPSAGGEAAPAVDEEIAAWRLASVTGGEAAYRGYLDAYPGGLFAGFARDRIAGLEARGAAAPDAGDVAALVAYARPRQLTAALVILGYLPPGSDAGLPDPTLRDALVRYAAQLPKGEPPSLDRLYADAARMTVALAAHNAQRLRSDLAALAGVDRTLGMAEEAGAQLAALAEGNAQAAALLVEARGDLAAIRSNRETVLARLDASRSQYEALIASAADQFGPWLGLARAGLSEDSAISGRMAADAELFLRHAALYGGNDHDGSYAWLSDFLPRN